MLHSIHQLGDNLVCLLFGAEHVAYSGFIGFLQKTAAWNQGWWELQEPNCKGLENQNNVLKYAKMLSWRQWQKDNSLLRHT